MQTILSQIEIVYEADRRCRRIALEISYGLIQTIYQRMEAKAGTVTYIPDQKTRITHSTPRLSPGTLVTFFGGHTAENILVPPP